MKLAKNLKFNRFIFSSALIILIAGCRSQQNPSLPAWLLGRWEAKYQGLELQETWTKKSNKEFQGITIWKELDSSAIEKTKLYIENDKINYEVSLNAQKVAFELLKTDNDTLVFVNKNKIGPKRIYYSYKSKNHIIAWFENDPENADSWYFDFRRK